MIECKKCNHPKVHGPVYTQNVYYEGSENLKFQCTLCGYTEYHACADAPQRNTTETEITDVLNVLRNGDRLHPQEH